MGCGEGTRTRYRTKNNAVCGGAACAGNSFEKKSCHLDCGGP